MDFLDWVCLAVMVVGAHVSFLTIDLLALCSGGEMLGGGGRRGHMLCWELP